MGRFPDDVDMEKLTLASCYSAVPASANLHGVLQTLMNIRKTIQMLYFWGIVHKDRTNNENFILGKFWIRWTEGHVPSHGILSYI